MVHIKIVLDTRRKKADGTFSVIYRITDVKKVYTISSGISIQESEWDEAKREVVKNHPNALTINTTLSKKYYLIQNGILKLEDSGRFSYEELKTQISGKPKIFTNTTFKVFSEIIIADMVSAKRIGNAIVYQTAVNQFLDYCKKPKIKFAEISYTMLDGFIQSLVLRGLRQNSIGNYLRSLRAIFNKAIKAKVVDREYYPFYDISIKTEKTKKRAIAKQDIINLENLHLKENSKEWHARNYFLLSYYLRGVSFTDLAYLKSINIVNGRITYRRRKTHKLYNVKLFKKAELLLDMYCSSKNNYLLPILCSSDKEDTLESKKLISQWIKTTNKYLNRIVLPTLGAGKLTTYVSRHTWATVAKKLGYSNELIAEALGHQYGNRITNIYLDDFDVEVIDEMHKRVIY